MKDIDLPYLWSLTTVKEAIQIIDYRGRTPPYTSNGIVHLRSSNIKGGRIIWEGLRFVSEKTYQEYMTRGIPTIEDVLFTTEAPLGEVALAPDTRFSLAQRLIVLRPNKRIFIPTFLLYQIQDSTFQRKLTGEGTGTTVRGVSSRNFKPMKLLVAPLNEQKRIVTKIETLQTRSTAVKEELEAIKPLLNQFRQSVLTAAFRGDLTKDWREQNPDGEPAKVLLERIRVERRQRWEEAELEKMKAKGKVPKDDKWKKRYKEPEPIDTGLSGLPNSWCWMSLGNVAWYVKDGPHYSPKYSNNGIPFISGGNIRPEGIDFNNVKYISLDLHEELSS